MRNMSRVEAFHILGEMMNDATVEQNEALTIAQYDIEFVDLMPDDMVHVVRCKDCRHCTDAHNDGFMYCMRPVEAEDYSETGYCYPLEVRVGFWGYCSYGEWKDGEG